MAFNAKVNRESHIKVMSGRYASRDNDDDDDDDDDARCPFLYAHGSSNLNAQCAESPDHKQTSSSR